MKREDIEKILTDAGVDEQKLKEAADAIFAEHGKDIEAEKSKLDAQKSLTDAKTKEVEKANDTIKELKETVNKFDGVDIEALKTSVKDWEKKYNDDIAAARAEHDLAVKGFTLKDALRQAGATDPDYVIYKLGGVEKFSFNEDGSVFGLDETIKSFKEANPIQFGKPGGGGYDPAGGGGEPPKDKSKMTYDELCAYYDAQPNE